MCRQRLPHLGHSNHGSAQSVHTNQHAVPVDPKIGAVSGKLVSPVAPSQLSHCPIDEPADTVEHCRIDTCAALDQAIERDAGVAMIVA